MLIERFWARVDALQHWHSRLIDKSWLLPAKPTRVMVLLIVLSGLIAAGMNGYVRYSQYQKWQENKHVFYLDDGTPQFTTTDAPYFLGTAQAIKRGGDLNQFDELRYYPHIRNDNKKHPKDTKLRDFPLLSKKSRINEKANK